MKKKSSIINIYLVIFLKNKPTIPKNTIIITIIIMIVTEDITDVVVVTELDASVSIAA